MNFETGDFREYDWLIDKCDIVVGNPPFSLFREFIDKIKDKDFLVIGNIGAPLYKNIFFYFFNGKVKLGYNKPSVFFDDNNNIKNVGTVWFTTLPVEDKPFLELTATYDPVKYPKYDNYDAINVDKVADIPKDYYGVIGVPITFLDKYNKNQFKIIGMGTGNNAKLLNIGKNYRGRTDLSITVNGKSTCPYNRLLIQRR